MAFTVQNDSGTAAGANAYVAVSYFKAYHDERGNSYGTAADPAIQMAIIKATDYLDTRFRFRGVRAHSLRDQPTAWPRLDVSDDDNNWVFGVPEPVKEACCEYALRALTKALNPDPVAVDDSGYSVSKISKTVGPISKSVEYSGGGSQQSLPRYPAADRILVSAGLLLAGGQLARA